MPQNNAHEQQNDEEEEEEEDSGEIDSQPQETFDDDQAMEEDTHRHEEEDAIAAVSIDQICRYSHKILRKYVVNGMIDLVDGPQLHNLVDARDYRIICIMEVFSQNKNEDDFLENLGLLSQVMKEGRMEEGDEP